MVGQPSADRARRKKMPEFWSCRPVDTYDTIRYDMMQSMPCCDCAQTELFFPSPVKLSNGENSTGLRNVLHEENTLLSEDAGCFADLLIGQLKITFNRKASLGV